MLQAVPKDVHIYLESNPNPNSLKFVINEMLVPEGISFDFPDAESAKPSPLATELFGFPFIKAVFIASNFVTLTKTAETDWQDVIPSVRQFLKDYLEEGKAVVNEEELAAVKKESSNEVSADDERSREDAVSDLQLAQTGHRGPHRVHDGICQEARGQR